MKNPDFTPEYARFYLTKAQGVCKTKAAYNTRAEARVSISRLHFKGTAYKCPFCGYFHNTTLDKRAFRKLKRDLRRAQLVLDPPSPLNPAA